MTCTPWTTKSVSIVVAPCVARQRMPSVHFGAFFGQSNSTVSNSDANNLSVLIS